MTKISHIIENHSKNNPGLVDLHTSFQYLSRIAPQHHLYKELARLSRGLWLYYEPDAVPTPITPEMQ